VRIPESVATLFLVSYFGMCSLFSFPRIKFYSAVNRLTIDFSGGTQCGHSISHIQSSLDLFTYALVP
jgi:hypothetical protein